MRHIHCRLIPENDDQVQVRDEIDHDQCDDEFELSTGRSKDEKDEADTGKESAAFMEKDTISSGGISLSAYGSYAIAAGGYWAIGLGVLTFFLNIGSNTFSNWWLAVWVQAGSGVLLPRDVDSKEMSKRAGRSFSRTRTSRRTT